MKQFALLLLVSIFSLGAMAQDNNVRNHELRAFYGETVTFDIANLIGNSITDAISGMRTDVNTYGAYGLGYRYHINRLSLGADVSYIAQRNDVKTDKNGPTDFRLNENYFLVLPTADFTYFKRGIFRLYGGAGLGAMLGVKSQKGLTTIGDNYLKINDYNGQTVDFAFQVTPLAIRLGNDRIGGFIEAGYGLKGLLNVGLSVNF